MWRAAARILFLSLAQADTNHLRWRDNESLWAVVTFADSGHGILVADQENVFEPFHTGRANGTGLGLSIARAIVEEHSGQLSFVNNTHGGTSFVMELPVKTSTTSTNDRERQ